MNQIHQIIKNACSAISEDKIEDAKKIINTSYPFSPLKNEGRKYTDYQKTKIFIRDGFIDRYSGDKMVFPPVLRLMSKLMPSVAGRCINIKRSIRLHRRLEKCSPSEAGM